MNSRLRLIPVVFCLLSLVLTTGCWDRRELESLAFVTGLGLDTAGDEILVTFVIPSPAATGGGPKTGGSGAGGGIASHTAITVKARTIGEAVARANRLLSRRITFLQIQILVLGEGFARSRTFQFMDLVTRYREFRRTVLVAVAQGEAREYFDVMPPVERDPVKYTVDLLRQASRNGGARPARFQDFALAVEAYGGEPTLPLVGREPGSALEHVHLLGGPSPGGGGGGSKGKQGGGSGKSGAGGGGGTPGGGSDGGGGGGTDEERAKWIETAMIKGTAVYLADKMVDKLDVNETFFFALAEGDLIAATKSYPFPGPGGKWVTLLFKQPEVNVKPGWRHGVPNVRLRLVIPCEVEGSVSVESPVDPHVRLAIERLVERDVTRGIQKVVRKTQAKRADIFFWGEHYRAQFTTWPEFARFAWRSRYPKAIVDIDVHVNIARMGTSMEPAPTH